MEFEIISFDAGLRLDGIPALVLWDLVFDLLHPKMTQRHSNQQATGETRCMTKHPRND